MLAFARFIYIAVATFIAFWWPLLALVLMMKIGWAFLLGLSFFSQRLPISPGIGVLASNTALLAASAGGVLLLGFFGASARALTRKSFVDAPFELLPSVHPLAREVGLLAKQARVSVPAVYVYLDEEAQTRVRSIATLWNSALAMPLHGTTGLPAQALQWTIARQLCAIRNGHALIEGLWLYVQLCLSALVTATQSAVNSALELGSGNALQLAFVALLLSPLILIVYLMAYCVRLIQWAVPRADRGLAHRSVRHADAAASAILGHEVSASFQGLQPPGEPATHAPRAATNKQ